MSMIPKEVIHEKLLTESDFKSTTDVMSAA